MPLTHTERDERLRTITEVLLSDEYCPTTFYNFSEALTNASDPSLRMLLACFQEAESKNFMEAGTNQLMCLAFQTVLKTYWTNLAEAAAEAQYEKEKENDSI